MPSFKSLQQNQPEKFKALVTFLGRLKTDSGTPSTGGSATPESSSGG